MSAPAILFDRVWKKFRRGERHDSLRDLIPSTVSHLFARARTRELRDHEFWALRDVSFAVPPGRALGIIGPNGAGKSTTLKLLTRILRPTKGTCWTKGRVGALIEVASGFHPDLTGRENIFLQGAIMGMKRADITRALDAIVDFAGISEFINTPVKRFSTGMNARLGFSIAAHLHPDVLIIDEVLSVGDMAFQQKCVSRMMEFKRSGAAIVFVSHNLQAAAALCDELLLLKTSVRSTGAPDKVIFDYLSSDVVATRPSTAVDFSASLTYSSGEDVTIVRPGASLRLRLECNFLTELDDFTFGFVVRRSTDGLAVYDANFSGEELGLPHAVRGQEAEFTVDFKAHLTRGHYDIGCHLVHNPSQECIAEIRPAASFSVDEHRTWGGVADLEANATHRLLA